ncbi:MAG: replicative DNA helicase [Kineosporiaceae bacterium]
MFTWATRRGPGHEIADFLRSTARGQGRAASREVAGVRRPHRPPGIPRDSHILCTKPPGSPPSTHRLSPHCAQAVIAAPAPSLYGRPRSDLCARSAGSAASSLSVPTRTTGPGRTSAPPASPPARAGGRGGGQAPERAGRRGGTRVSIAELSVPNSGPSEEFGRTPPQDIVAEQSVLGGMLLSKDAIADVIEELRGTDFYRPAHELVYEAILDLYGRGEPADAITVADELTKRGELGRIGGPAYLHTLLSSVPTAANAGYYAKIVRERAVLRRLVEAGTRIVQLGYAADGGDVEELVNEAQAEVYAVAERRKTEDYAPIGEIIEGTIDEIEASSHRSDGMIGVPTGFIDLDRLTNGLHPGQMIVIAARPAMGKSTVGLDICRSAAIHARQAAVIFSLEMSRNEIVMRLLSAEATIPLQNMRKGTMREEDWTRLARTMGNVSEAPLFIDDSPNMSLMEIRAKCRRLKQRNDLKLVVIDYLQLMTSGKRVENRQQEVSEFSRALKLLAKELEVPVIAISQLNRGPEQRTDKKPQMSDLRESGCLPASARVLRADTGAEVSLGELYAAGERDVPVWSLDESLRYVRRHLTHVFATGTKPVFRLRLSSGRTVRATGNHPFLTVEGWRPLDELVPGARLAVPRHVPPPDRIEPRSAGQLRDLAAALAGDIAVEADLSCLPKAQVGELARLLWARCGGVGLGEPGRVWWTLADAAHARSLAASLLRYGISCRHESVTSTGEGVRLVVDDADDLRRVLGEVLLPDGTVRDDETAPPVHEGSLLVARRLFAALRSPGAAQPTAGPSVGGGVVPAQSAAADPGVWDEVRSVLDDDVLHARELVAATAVELAAARRGAHAQAPLVPQPTLAGMAPSRERLARVVAVLDRAELDIHALNDVLWDTVEAIEPDGVEEVYDATVLGTHNFVADGIAVHNSIEQDADMVILLHREDAYEKESPRAGEADFIVAKHRNGPTDTITVAFQGHYSRFVDMAAG